MGHIRVYTGSKSTKMSPPATSQGETLESQSHGNALIVSRSSHHLCHGLFITQKHLGSSVLDIQDVTQEDKIHQTDTPKNITREKMSWSLVCSSAFCMLSPKCCSQCAKSNWG